MATGTPSDARFRPFRGAAWALYLIMAVGYSSLVIYSVTKSVMAMSPRAETNGTKLDAKACVSGVRELFGELSRTRHGLSADSVRDADKRWLAFRNEWVVRFNTLEDQCRDVNEPALKRAFVELDRVMDHATVDATRLSGQLGPALDALSATLTELESLLR